MIDLNEEKYKLYFENSPEVIVLLDDNGKIVDINKRVFEWVGYSPDEIIGQSVVSLPFIPLTSKTIILKNFLARISGMQILPYEVEFINKSGLPRFGRIIGSRINDSQGKLYDLVLISDITEERRLQKLNSENEQRFETLIKKINYIVYDYDLDNGKLVLKGSVETITGYKPEELMVNNFNSLMELVHPDDRIILLDRLKNIRQPQISVELEYRIRKKDGSSVWVRDTGGVITNRENKQVRILGTISDITYYKQQEEQKIIQTAALSAAANAIIITDPNGNIVYINPAFSELTGYTKEELIGKNPSILKSGKQTEEFYKNLWSTINSKNVWHGELINRKKDGSFYIDEMTITPVQNREGKIINFIGMKQDISNKKASEEEIRIRNLELEKIQAELKKEKESVDRIVEERTRELKIKSEALKIANDKVSQGWHAIQREKSTLTASIGSLPLGFILTDRNLNILTVNQFAKNLLKLETENINLADIDKVFSLHINLLKLIENSRTNYRTIDMQEVKFEDKYVHLSVTPVFTPVSSQNEYLGSVILIGDITERKLLDRSRDEFFSIASHELRTPLTAIRGNAELLRVIYKDRLSDREFAEMVEDIHTSSVRLIEIVNDFLNTSRLELHKLEFKKEIILLSELVTSVISELSVQAENNNIFLKFDNPQNLTYKIMADKNRTKEVLINLVGNALKFTHKGGITVRCQRTGNYIETIVSDTGTGIKKGNENLLFRKFQQAEANIYTRDSTQGTGLGLYISKLMVNGMEGDIRLVSSAENNGSAFSFTLPAFEEDQNYNGLTAAV